MEDVLEVYQRPYDPLRPVVCLDETSKQMIIETRAPLPAAPGRKARHDYEYERGGVANLFMMFAPLEGWRHVKVTDRRTAIDYAHALKDLSDTHFPKAAKIVLVQDNLSTHKPASLYEAFPPSEARRLVERFEWHYTPKHGSWLDMAESELGVPQPRSGSPSPTNKPDQRSSTLGRTIATPSAKADCSNSQPPTPALLAKGYRSSRLRELGFRRECWRERLKIRLTAEKLHSLPRGTPHLGPRAVAIAGYASPIKTAERIPGLLASQSRSFARLRAGQHGPAAARLPRT